MAGTAKKKDDGVLFTAWIAAMSLRVFCEFCGFLWNTKVKRFTKWELWPKQIELFNLLDTEKYLWLLKARQLGVSESAAFYAIKIALVEPNSDIVIVSKKEKDAKYFLRKRVLDKLKAIYTSDATKGFPWPKFEPGESRVIFENGSQIIACSSSNDEVRSMTCRLIIFDEAAFFTDNDANELWTAMLPTIEEQPRGQVIVISTAKFGTWFNEMSQKILSGKVGGIKLFFMPANSHPSRTPEWMTAKAAKYPDEKLFKREYPQTIDDCFISREGAVFQSYDDTPGGSHVKDEKLDWTWDFLIGLDWGFDHPTVLLFALYDRYKDFLYIFDEVYCRGDTIDIVGKKIRDRLAYWKSQGAPPPKKKIADTQIFANDGRRTIAETLRNATGIMFTGAYKYDKEGSLALAQWRMVNRKVAFHPRCEELREQTKNLKWKVTSDGRSLDEPIKEEDDGPDVYRYLCAEIHKGVKAEKPVVDLHFNPEFSEHRRQVRERILARMPLDDLDPNHTPWEAG